MTGLVSPLGETPVADDTVGLLEGITTTRSIRRYRDEPVPPDVLRDLCFAASRAPTGSNRQPFRLVVLTEGEIAHEAKLVTLHVFDAAPGEIGRRLTGAPGEVAAVNQRDAYAFCCKGCG